MEANKFKQYLQVEFTRRSDINPAYSLRAFARHLAVDAASLSKIMSGNINAGSKLQSRLVERLEGNQISVKKPTQADYHELTDIQASAMSSWYAYAILELIELKNGKISNSQISKLLEINIKKVEIAVDAMLSAKILKQEANGKMVDTTNSRTTFLNSSYSSSAIQRSHQKSLILKSLESIDFEVYEERDHSSMTFTMNQSDMEEAKTMLRDFRRQLARKFSSKSKEARVYNLSLGFFPLSIKEH